MAFPVINPVLQFFDNSGEVLDGGLLYTYEPGTTTPKTTYTDENLSTPNTNPIVLSSAGRCTIFTADDSEYKYVLQTSAGVTLRTVDEVKAPVGTQAGIGALLYPRTDAEIAEGVTPAFYIYAPSPKIDPRRYSATGDGVTDDTTAMQTAINMAYANKGRLIIPDNFIALCGALSLTMSGDWTSQALSIEGMSALGSQIKQTGSPGVLLAFNGATPTGNPNAAPLILENFSLIAPGALGKSAHGLRINGLSSWRISGLQIRGFDRGIDLSSALVGIIDQGTIALFNNYGIYARRNGAGSGCNQIAVRDSQFSLNTNAGADIGSGGNWGFYNCDIEANGTSDNLSTGGMLIQSTIDDEFGLAIVTLDGVWLEGNLGRSLTVASTSGLSLVLRNTNLLSGEDGREVSIAGASSVSIEDTFSGVGSDWTIAATRLVLKNTTVGTLTDTSTYPDYHNVQTTASYQLNGRNSSYTGTLTGCTTSPTASILVREQQDCVELEIPSLTATSNTSACTITGMPAALFPSAQRTVTMRVTDNGTTSMAVAQVQTNGTLTLFKDANGGTFTTSGSKGSAPSTIRYKK